MTKRYKKLSNYNVRTAVQNHEEFDANNIFSRWEETPTGAMYVVYSYGLHYPMFIYVPDIDHWFSNSTKYSRTTSKHRSQAHPLVGEGDITGWSTDKMTTLLRDGYSTDKMITLLRDGHRASLAA